VELGNLALARYGAGAINNKDSRGATNGKTRKQTRRTWVEGGCQGNVRGKWKMEKLLAAVSKVEAGGLGPAEIDLCAICFGSPG